MIGGGYKHNNTLKYTSRVHNTGTWGVYYIYLSNYFYKSIFGFISFVPRKVFTKKYDASEPERMIRPSSVFARFAPPALTEDHAEALRRDGICVVDEAIPVEQVRDLRDALERETGGFRQTMQAKEIRSDKVRWVSEEEEGSGGDAGVIGSAVRMLKGIGSRFEEVLGHALDAFSVHGRGVRAQHPWMNQADTDRTWTTGRRMTMICTGCGRAAESNLSAR